MKAAVNNDRTHNPFDEACWASRLRENLTSGSYGEGLETGRGLMAVPRQPFTRQASFRDTKDLRFGMGMTSVRVKDPQRRDRLLLISALAIALLSLLGAAGERLGYDRWLKANTVKRRTHSLFRQGLLLYDFIPSWPEERLRPLLETFNQMLREQRGLREIFGVI